MATESTNSSSVGDNQRQLDRELRDMISHLNSRTGHLRQAQDPDQEDNGVRIITLAGTNTGATLKSDLGAEPRRRPHQTQGIKLAPTKEGDNDDDDDGDEGETEDLGTLVNSNFQAVNNSIMLSGSFSSNDPGVRVEISGGVDHPHHQHRRHGHKMDKSPEEAGNSRSKETRYQPIAGSSK